jgi:putative oxidoreductase
VIEWAGCLTMAALRSGARPFSRRSTEPTPAYLGRPRRGCAALETIAPMRTLGAEVVAVKQGGRLAHWLLNPPVTGSPAILFLRLMAGGVFVSEGVLKFAYPATLGVGRFAKLGFPVPGATAAFVGVVEVACGVLLVAGLLTRAAAIPFVIEMIVAILSTKISLYQGTSPLPLPPVPPQTGWAAVLHESRSDVAQLLTSLYLAIAGPGSWSLDALIRHGHARVAQSQTTRPRREIAEREAVPPVPGRPGEAGRPETDTHHLH